MPRPYGHNKTRRMRRRWMMSGMVSAPETLPLPQQIARMDATRMRAYRENLEFFQGRQ